MTDRINRVLIAFAECRSAVTSLEYGLIAGVLAAVMVVGAVNMGHGLSAKFTALNGQL